VLAALGSGARIDKNLAFEADTLLGDLPFLWTISLLELGLLGAAGVFGGDDQDPAPST
jgi:hypothetical protein